MGDQVNPLKESNGSQFYIVENKNGTDFLDGDYTVFGIVFNGMNAVEAIANEPTDNMDKPFDDVVMNKVHIIELSEEQLLDQYDFKIP